MNALRRTSLSAIAAVALVLVAAAGSQAQTPSPQSSASPSATPAASYPLYQMTDDIYTINRAGTLYYYFQENPDGTAKVKQEIRLTRNLGSDNAQLQIRVPVMTRYPLVGSTSSGLGNIELGYSYHVTSATFDHSLEVRGSFAASANNVSSNDTQLKAFYTTKWKWKGGALSYANEYDQTVIQPPGSSYTSYYDGKLSLPEYAFVHYLRGVKLSAIYNYRILFDTGGIWKGALGGTLFGNLGFVALSITDTWGVGNPLWKYKFEANATAKF